jgi:alpha-beta hydrolase superfamily lysophospholipase
MVLADNEYVTDPKVQKKAVNLFKNIEVLNLPSCRHDIFQEKDEVQQLFWKGIDQFIDKNKSKFETALS